MTNEEGMCRLDSEIVHLLPVHPTPVGLDHAEASICLANMSARQMLASAWSRPTGVGCTGRRCTISLSRRHIPSSLVMTSGWYTILLALRVLQNITSQQMPMVILKFRLTTSIWLK